MAKSHQWFSHCKHKKHLQIIFIKLLFSYKIQILLQSTWYIYLRKHFPTLHLPIANFSERQLFPEVSSGYIKGLYLLLLHFFGFLIVLGIFHLSLGSILYFSLVRETHLFMNGPFHFQLGLFSSWENLERRSERKIKDSEIKIFILLDPSLTICSSWEHLHYVTYCGLLIQQELFMRRRPWLLMRHECLSSLKVKSRPDQTQAKFPFWALLSLFYFCNLLQLAGTISSEPSYLLRTCLLSPTCRPALCYTSP